MFFDASGFGHDTHMPVSWLHGYFLSEVAVLENLEQAQTVDDVGGNGNSDATLSPQRNPRLAALHIPSISFLGSVILLVTGEDLTRKPGEGIFNRPKIQ